MQGSVQHQGCRIHSVLKRLKGFRVQNTGPESPVRVGGCSTCAGGLVKAVSRHSSGERNPYVFLSAKYVALTKFPRVFVEPVVDVYTSYKFRGFQGSGFGIGVVEGTEGTEGMEGIEGIEGIEGRG